ncbi:MAG: translation elongation factor Ts [Thermoleophilia bacterium]|nr:translation elongation factor Ts [Thermoleophilia bacterium]
MSATISAGLVKELRELTGAGMMDCKRALEETGGDVEAAQKLLREKGMAAATKRAARETTEGVVLSRVEDGRGTIVAVGCETEPVSKNDEFRAFAARVLDAVAAGGPAAVAGLEDERVELVARIGENVAVRGVARLQAGEGEVVAAYVHPPANKIGVLVRARSAPELARLVAMHVSFASPGYLTRDEVPVAAIQAEREVYEKLPDVQAKPDEIRARIVDGMLAKRFFADSVLADQAWIHDDSLTVGKALAEHGAEVLEFVRYSLAE